MSKEIDDEIDALVASIERLAGKQIPGKPKRRYARRKKAPAETPVAPVLPPQVPEESPVRTAAEPFCPVTTSDAAGVGLREEPASKGHGDGDSSPKRRGRPRKNAEPREEVNDEIDRERETTQEASIDLGLTAADIEDDGDDMGFARMSSRDDDDDDDAIGEYD